VQFTFPGSGGGRSPKTRKALADLMNAMYLDNLEEETARGQHNDPPPKRMCSVCNKFIDISNPDSIMLGMCEDCLSEHFNDIRNGN